jgi:enoyl-CoA hydratase/carnithine racemase
MPIRTAKSGPVAVVTIDAPETRNALDGRSGRELIAAFDDVAADGGVSALVLRGAGGHFCAGADRALLASARERPQDPEIIAALEAIYDSFERLANLPILTVAALRGAAVGAGCNLALAADVRIASDTARLLSGFVRIGLHPGGGHFSLLSRLAGPQAAAGIALLGEEVSGRRLVDLGLAWEVLEDTLVDDRAVELAGRLTDVALARDAVASLRAQTQHAGLPISTAIRLEQIAQFKSLIRASSDSG